MDHAFQYPDKASVKQGSFDILWAIKQIQNGIPLSIKYQHVKGHQDKEKRPLTLLETLNYIMGKRSGQYHEYIEMSTMSCTFPTMYIV